MGEDIQSECQKYRGREEDREESQKGEVVLHAVCYQISSANRTALYDSVANGCLRKPKHDRGSVEGIVEEYLKRRRLIRSGALGMRTPNTSVKNPIAARSGVKAR